MKHIALRMLKLLGMFWLVSFCCTSLTLAQTDTTSGIFDNTGALLAHNGQALQPIVISAKASESTKGVAAELASYLKRITGAEFEVKTGDGKSGIVLGSLAEFPNAELKGVLAIQDTHDGKEAFAIRTVLRPVQPLPFGFLPTNFGSSLIRLGAPPALLLIGATDKGVSHAAFRFLELLGYRHFFPAPEWEVIPSIPTLQVKINENDRPTILARRIAYGYGFFRDQGKKPAEWRAPRDFQAWCRHNRMDSSFTVRANHAWQAIIADNKAAFDAHPEYYALVKGKDGVMARRRPQLCVSNPGLRKLAIDFIRNRLKENPDFDMVSIEPADGYHQCECAECKKLGKDSNQAFFLANEVARVVGKEFPGRMVGLLAYGWHSEPPDFPLEPNIYVQLTAGFTRGKYTFEELLDLWPRKAKHLGIYEYFSVWPWDFDRLPGGRGGNISYLKKRIGEYAEHNVTSISAESGNNWGPHGRGYYIANRLMWNPKADVDALLTDFYEKAFGPAAPAMRRYYERVDAGSQPLMSRHLLALAFRDVQEASTVAKDRPEVLARIDHIKQYLRYVHLRWMFDRARDKPAKKKLALSTITHAYRTRYSYMNHWQAILQGWAKDAAEQFNEPTWAPGNRTAKPWMIDTFYTREETEQAFQEGLEYFQPQPVTEKSFSNDLVPVSFEGATATASEQWYQGSMRYLLYSLKGEPLEVEVVTGTYAAFRDRADARYTLLSAGEKEIVSGRLPLDGETHKIILKVPGPGLYSFDFTDPGAGWRIKVASERIVTIPLRRERPHSHLGKMQPMYFYVPKGTRQIEYFWAGNQHKLMRPDNRVALDVRTNGEFVTIPVPAGMDGKVWSFTQMSLKHLWFFNIPNYLAASPNALLLPREVVRADGLVVRR